MATDSEISEITIAEIALIVSHVDNYCLRRAAAGTTLSQLRNYRG